MNKEEMIDEFVEEIWDCVYRLRVGSGLTTKEVLKALERVKVLVKLEIITEAGDENER